MNKKYEFLCELSQKVDNCKELTPYEVMAFRHFLSSLRECDLIDKLKNIDYSKCSLNELITIGNRFYNAYAECGISEKDHIMLTNVVNFLLLFVKSYSQIMFIQLQSEKCYGKPFLCYDTNGKYNVVACKIFEDESLYRMFKKLVGLLVIGDQIDVRYFIKYLETYNSDTLHSSNDYIGILVYFYKRCITKMFKDEN